MQATVYRTFSRSAQSVLATALGIVVSVTVAELPGLGAATPGIALLLALVLARAGLLRDEGVTIGYEHEESMLLDRFLDTAIGVG